MSKHPNIAQMHFFVVLRTQKTSAIKDLTSLSSLENTSVVLDRLLSYVGPAINLVLGFAPQPGKIDTKQELIN